MTLRSLSSRATSSLAIGGLLLLGASAGYIWYISMGPGRYAEAERFKEQLAQIPGVTDVEVYGHDDVGYEINGFHLELDGHRILSLGGLEDPSSDQLERIHIYRIGDQEVTYAMEGFIGVYDSRTDAPMRSTGHGNGFTVGAKGAHAHLFPFRLHSVAEVVQHYDEICAVISAWPVQPDYAKLVDNDGVRWFYALADPTLSNNWLQPAELE